MPAKHSLKTYLENGFYHIYNRGVDKRTIFKDQQDYGTFLGYLKELLSPPTSKPYFRKITVNNKAYEIKDYCCKNCHQTISLLAYCLMPNHFHLLINQSQPRAIEDFMKSLGTRYTMYFNKRYQRSGRLFQGVYQAVLIENEPQLLHTSRYIHLNPLSNKSLLNQPSSYSDYLRLKNTSWLKPEKVLECFKSAKAYQQFIQDQLQPTGSILENLTLD